jgi:ParB family chromosome partitioning protein
MSSQTKKYSFLAENEELENRKMYNVPVELLGTYLNQPRKYFDEQAMEELEASIDKQGVLQPLLIYRDEEGNLIIISGERRFRAAQKLQMETVPAIYIDGGNNAEIALVENLLRENLNPIEEAEAIHALKKEQGYTNVQISAALGKSESTISEILSLVKLPDSVKEECRENTNCTRRGLVEIAKAKDEKTMLLLFGKYRKKELSREEVRAAVGEKKAKVEDWKKKVNGFDTQIKKIDFQKLGDQSRPVETALKSLKVTIEGVLPANS